MEMKPCERNKLSMQRLAQNKENNSKQIVQKQKQNLKKTTIRKFAQGNVLLCNKPTTALHILPRFYNVE